MKKRVIVLFVAFVVMGGLSYSRANDEAKAGAHEKKISCPHHDWGKKKEEYIAHKLTELNAHYSLTADQQAKAKELLGQSKDEIIKIMQEAQVRTREINKATQEKIKALLTDEQKAKHKGAHKDSPPEHGEHPQETPVK